MFYASWGLNFNAKVKKNLKNFKRKPIFYAKYVSKPTPLYLIYRDSSI